jgi:hypothetical protein
LLLNFDNIIEYNFGLNKLIEMRDNKVDYTLNKDTGEPNLPCEVRVEEIMSDRPRKFSGTENPNISEHINH